MMPPKKSVVNEIQTEEAATVGSPVRRSARNANGNGAPAAGVTTRRTSTTAESVSSPAKVTRGRRASTSSAQSEEIVEAKPIRGRRASALAEEEPQKPAPSTPTRRGRKPSVTLEPVDQEEPEKPKPARSRRLSRANSEDPEAAEQPAKTVRGRRTSTTNNSEEVEELKPAPARARRGSVTAEPESAPKTPARATGRRRGSATESVEVEVSTPAKRVGRGRKVSESTEEVFEEEKKPAARGRRKSVTKDEETTKEEPAKPATRRGRRASTDSSEVVAPKTPARVTRRSSINQEDKSNEPIEVVTEEVSPVIIKDVNIKLTPLKKRKIIEKVEAELDLSIINESADDLNISNQNQSINKAAAANFPKEQHDSPRASKRLSNEGEAACPSPKKSPRLSDQLQVESRENSPIRTSPRLSAKLVNSSPVRTSPRLSAKFAKNQVEQEEASEEKIKLLTTEETQNEEKVEVDETIISPNKCSPIKAKLNLEKEIQASPALEKSVSHVSTGSEGSFRFHLSTVSLPEESHEDKLNESKDSTGSNKENVDLDASTNAQNKSEIIPLQPKIVARISNVFKTNQRDFSFQEPMDVDYSMLVNDTLGDKTTGTLDESSVDYSKIIKSSDISDSDECSVVFNKNPQSSNIHPLSELDETTSDLPSIIVETCDKKEGGTESEKREELVIDEAEKLVVGVNEPVEKLRLSSTRKTSSPITIKRRSSRKSTSPASREDRMDNEGDNPKSPSPQQQDEEINKQAIAGRLSDNKNDKVESALLSVRRSKSRSKSPIAKSSCEKDQCEENEDLLDVAPNDSTISANKAKQSVSPLAPQQIIAAPNLPRVSEVKHSESTVYDFELPSDDSDLDDSKERTDVIHNQANQIETIEETQDENMECEPTEGSLLEGESHIKVVNSVETSNAENESRYDQANSLQEVQSEKNDDLNNSNKEQSNDDIVKLHNKEPLADHTQDVADKDAFELQERSLQCDHKKDESHADVKENLEVSENSNKTNEESNIEYIETDLDNEKAPEASLKMPCSDDAKEATNDNNIKSKDTVELKEDSYIEKSIGSPKLIVAKTVCKDIPRNEETGDSKLETSQCGKKNTGNVKIRDSLNLEESKQDEMEVTCEENIQETSESINEDIPTNEETGSIEIETDPCTKTNTENVKTRASLTLKDLKQDKIQMESEENIQEASEAVDEEISRNEEICDSEIETDECTKKNIEPVKTRASFTLKKPKQDKIQIESEKNVQEASETVDEEILTAHCTGRNSDTTKTRASLTLNNSKQAKLQNESKELSMSESISATESNKSLRSRYSLDEFASAKLEEFLKSKIVDIEDSDSSEGEEESENEYHEFIDGMAEEGEEDTPSEDSNQIIDEGESIGSSDSDGDKSDDNYEDDSFICDDDDVEELLSGEEYDLEDDKKKTKKKSRIIDPDTLTEEHDVLTVPKKEQKVKPKKKKSRIIEVSDSSDEEDRVETKSHIEQSNSVIILEDTKEDTVNEDSKLSQINEVSGVIVLEDTRVPDDDMSKFDDSSSQIAIEDSKNNFSSTQSDVPTETNMESPSVQNVSLTAINNSLQQRNRRSSLSIHENIMVDGKKVPMITQRINSLVESFCSSVSKGEVSLNLSLEFEDTKQPSKTEPVHIVSDIQIRPGFRMEAIKPLEDNQKAEAEEVDKFEETKDLREVISKNRLKRRLSRSLTELFTEEKKAKRRKKTKSQRSSSADAKKKTNKKTRPDVSEVSNVGSFSLMSQLITDVKNRPKRIPKPSTDVFETSWMVTPVEDPRPSKKTLTKTEKLKMHPKDFKNQLLSDPQRVRRVETKTLLKKKGANLK